jgi:hypothetical protein
MLLRLDGAFLGAGEIAPRIIGIDQHEVFLGASLNEEFPYECEINEDGDDECFIRPLLGELDVVRIFDEAFFPTQMSAEVNRANGDITLKGGEFQRDVQYYEISSEGGALNSAAWAGGNLDQQNLDSVGDGSGDTWDVLTASSERVVEAFLKGGTLFEDGTEVTLSGTWGGGAEDLLFQIVTSNNDVLSLDVNYVGEGNGNQGGVCNPNTLGDIDENGTVDFGDFLILSANFGQAAVDHKTGDIDCNGTVAFGDFLVLSSNFGQAVSVAAASVPEPSSWVMIWMVSLVGLAFARRG